PVTSPHPAFGHPLPQGERERNLLPSPLEGEGGLRAKRADRERGVFYQSHPLTRPSATLSPKGRGKEIFYPLPLRERVGCERSEQTGRGGSSTIHIPSPGLRPPSPPRGEGKKSSALSP